MTSTFIDNLVSSLSETHIRVLREAGTKGTQVADGDGKARYELKRKGLVTVTRPNRDGQFTVYRTALGHDVVTMLAPKPRPRRKAKAAQEQPAV